MRPLSFFLHNPYEIFVSAAKKVKVLFPDETFLKIIFRSRKGYKLNLKNPKAFSEKLQWLKLHDRRPEYVKMVDKYAVKDYVSSILGPEITIPTLGVWDTVDDIEWDKLPDQFVLKCTHDSGGIVICRDKSKLDRKEAKKKLKYGLHRDYYLTEREWPYKNVKRRIIAEQLLLPRTEDGEVQDLYDYKFFTFNGEPKVLLFCSERKNGTSKWDFFDMEMNRIPVAAIHHCTTTIDLDKVIDRDAFERMKSIARALSKDLAFVSVDLYYVNKQIYFGELTFYSGSGFLSYDPADFDITLGNMLKLPIE